MKVESPEFTEAEIDGFVTDYFEDERRGLIRRLEKIVEETDALVPAIQGREQTPDDSWSAVETLAHMATTAQFFGWLVHEVVTKKEIDVDIVGMIKLRDIVTNDAADLPPKDLAGQVRQNIERTIHFIKDVPYDDLRVRFQYVGRELTAEDVIRIPLSAHLESHIRQMKAGLTSV